MGIRSTLTKSIRRTKEDNKPQLKSPASDSSKPSSSFRKGSNQGDSDHSSEATSFSSSVNGSTTSSRTSSTDRYSSGVEGGKQQRKTLDKFSSHKVTDYRSIRPVRRRLQSQLKSLPDDDPAAVFSTERADASPDLQKPVQKFTRSGSLRSLKILRRKNTSSSESKKTSTVKDSHSKKATFSSILKDSKFPEQVEPQGGVQSEEVLSAATLCSYEHCSLHGNHHHHHEPLLKRFSYLKRRSSKDKKCLNPQDRATDKHFVNKKEPKVTKKVSNEGGKEKDVDFSIEFYAKTRSEPSLEPNCGRDDVYQADIMFRVNSDDQNEVQNLQMDDQDLSVVSIDEENDSLDRFADVEGKKPDINNNNQMSMWRLIHRYMESGLIMQQLQEDEKQFCFDDDDDVNQGKEIQKMFAVKIVREAIEKILLPDEEGSENNQGDADQTEPNQKANDLFSTKNDKPKGWKHVKKVVLMELEKAKKKLDPIKHGHVLLALEPEPESEIVSLRSQTSGEKKDSNEWMLDYALQQVVVELAPTQKRKVALLVKSFEMVTPKLEKGVTI